MVDVHVEFPVKAMFLVVAAISLVVLVVLVRRNRLLAATLTAAITVISTTTYLLEPESPRTAGSDTTDPPKKKRPVIVLDVNRIHGPSRTGAMTGPTMDSNPREFVTVGNQVLFAAREGIYEGEGEDATAVENHRIYRYYQESLGVYTAEAVDGWKDPDRRAEHLTAHGNDLYFAATASGASQLWHMTSAYVFSQVEPEAGGETLGVVHGIVADGVDVMVFATIDGGNDLALWKVTAAGQYEKAADTPLEATTTTHFLDCDHAAGGFLAMAVGSTVGNFSLHCWTESAAKNFLYHDVTELAAFDDSLFLAGKEETGSDPALLYVDLGTDGAVSGAGGNPGTLFAGTSWLYFAVDSGGQRVPRKTKSISTVSDVETGGAAFGEVYAFTKSSAGTVWFAGEASAGVGLWEIDLTGSFATKKAELTGAGPIADLAGTTNRIVALTTNSDYFWYHDSTETVNELPKDLKTTAEPAGPLHTWGERVLFAAEHSTYGLEPYHFPELSY